MNKYLFFIIIGIILFVLYNHINSFSIGIPTYVLLQNSDGTYSINESGGAGDGSERRLWQGNLEEAQFNEVNQRIQQYPMQDPRSHFLFFNEEAEAEAVTEPCPQLSEGVPYRLCQPEPESCAASQLRNSLDGPGLCGQPSVVGTGLSGSRRTPCSRFLQTNAVRCFADNPEIMRSLFEEYELLSGLLALPVDQVTQIQNVPGFESLDPTMEREMLRSTFGPAFVPIFDFIRTNCQLFRFNDVLEILGGITLDNNHFKDFNEPIYSSDSEEEISLKTEDIDLEEIKRRSRIIIYILLLLIKCNISNDLIKHLLNTVISSYLSRNNSENSDSLDILYALFNGFYSMSQLNQPLNDWIDLQGDRFEDYRSEFTGRYYIYEIHQQFTYEDYINLFQYLSNYDDGTDASQRSDIISALMDPIFRNFFGLPDP